jgi:rhodanese-related sulfurtransferase
MVALIYGLGWVGGFFRFFLDSLAKQEGNTIKRISERKEAACGRATTFLEGAMKKSLKRAIGRKIKPLQDAGKARKYFESIMRFTLGPAELRRRMLLGDALNVIDVRQNSSYCEAHIPGAINLSRDSWETAQGLSKDRINVLYCGSQQCHLAPEACLYYAGQGYPVMHLEGGMDAWRDYGFDVETAPVIEEDQPPQEMAHAA